MLSLLRRDLTNYKASIIIPLSLVVASCALGQQNSTHSAEKKKESGKETRLEQQLLGAIGPLQSNLDELETLLTNTKSPIKVRGGAMTFHTKGNGAGGIDGWTPVPGTNQFCTSVKIDRFIIDGYEASTNAALSGLEKKAWMMTFHGHSPDGTTGSNGVVLTYDPLMDCDRTAGKSSVMIRPLSDGSDFYPDLTSNPPNYKGRKRFKDKVCRGKYPSPSVQDYDTDLCETVSLVEVHFTGGAPSSSIPEDIKLTCTHGDCVLGLGKP